MFPSRTQTHRTHRARPFRLHDDTSLYRNQIHNLHNVHVIDVFCAVTRQFVYRWRWCSSARVLGSCRSRYIDTNITSPSPPPPKPKQEDRGSLVTASSVRNERREVAVCSCGRLDKTPVGHQLKTLSSSFGTSPRLITPPISLSSHINPAQILPSYRLNNVAYYSKQEICNHRI
jgi:hypothetical protein